MRHTHVPTSSILLILGSVLCFTMLDTITKFMTQRYSVPVLVWARYTVQFLAMLVWLGPSMRLRLFHTDRLQLQVVRGGVLLASSLFFVGALRSLPLANATALNYTTPVLVVLMARLVLGERMTPARVAFVVAGLAGMLLIVRPGSDVFRGASLLALLAALCYATYQIMTRVLYGESPRVLLFYPAVVGAAVMTALAPGLDWPAHMPWQHAVLIVVGGLLGTLGHFLFILAFQHGACLRADAFHLHATRLGDLDGLGRVRLFPRRHDDRRDGRHRAERAADHAARATARNGPGDRARHRAMIPRRSRRIDRNATAMPCRFTIDGEGP